MAEFSENQFMVRVWKKNVLGTFQDAIPKFF
jgi:hypothetical protein